LQATDTVQKILAVVVPVGELVLVVYIPAIGVVSTEFVGTPPVAVIFNTVKAAIGIAVTARQGGKTIRVLARVTPARIGSTAIIPAFLCL